MAYINVASWTPDQVTDWMKGLDDCLYNYIDSFTNNEVDGRKLLNIRPYELEQLGMFSVGHQEIILEATENLRNFHYNLDKENLQFLALQLASSSENLYRQLTNYCDKSKIETQILNDITRTIATIKPLVAWLERVPFKGHFQFNELRQNILRRGLEMATMAQRDRFVENPVDQIHDTAKELSKLADYIIQDITDPMLLQPAFLNLVTLKKKESELGFNLIPSYHGMHMVSEIKFNSPAHNSGKIEDGDEIVQINYQTIVGWQYKTVILHLRESSPDVLLTLKKRPKHTKIYGQIYMQPYRLPSKRKAFTTRWGESLPSPRSNFLAVPEFNLPSKFCEKSLENTSDTDSNCSDDIILSKSNTSDDKEVRMYYPKPRAVLQRRNTICGNDISSFKNIPVSLWQEQLVGREKVDPPSPSLRDKSISFGNGLELAPRPTTCIGLSVGNNKFSCVKELNDCFSLKDKEKELKTKDEDIPNKSPSEEECKINSKSDPCKVVRFSSKMKINDCLKDNKYVCNVENTILETFEPIPFADEEDNNQPEYVVNIDEQNNSKKNVFDFEENKINKDVSSEMQFENDTMSHKKRRGKLDKSHSTPTYDNSEDDSSTPPSIEPRKQFVLTTPPIPPRQKRKPNLQSIAPLPPPKSQNLVQNLENIGNSQDNFQTNHSSPPAYFHFQFSNITKSSSSKKKTFLITKRRKINLKTVGSGEIQGFLYRRTKDKRGVTFWSKSYFVLAETVLYGFRHKDAQKASFMVLLPGFIVSIAEEVHSKPFAFKIYHSAKTFYFAAESSTALEQWMEYLKKAASFNNSNLALNFKNVDLNDLYSENESSGDENNKQTNIMSSKKNQNASNQDTTLNNSKSNTNEIIFAKFDNKYLGSLRKLTKSSLSFKHISNSNNVSYMTEKRKNSDLPEPTDHFRTFRKKPGSSFGVQIGGFISPNEVKADNNKKNQVPLVEKTINTSLCSNYEGKNDITNLEFAKKTVIENTDDSFEKENQSGKLINVNSNSYIHASNPNLMEFDSVLNKPLEILKINSTPTSWETTNTLQGFQLTLRDLMLQKQQEEAQDMYNNRVFLGMEKKGKLQGDFINQQKATSDSNEFENFKIISKNKNPIQMRTLPKTPDYEMSFKLDDEEIKKTRTKEGLKLRDFGYELIPGDDVASKKYNKFRKNYLEFQNNNNFFECDKLSITKANKKNVAANLKKFKDTYESSKKNVDIESGTAGNISKNQVCNTKNEDKNFKKTPHVISHSKLLFTSTSKNAEKKILGSPRLHRALFGYSSYKIDQEKEPNKKIAESNMRQGNNNVTSINYSFAAPTKNNQHNQTILQENSQIITKNFISEYPNIECPPVFEAETYSLSEPNASLSLLRKKQGNPENV